MFPVVMPLHVLGIPIAAAFIVSVNPFMTMMAPMARYPDPMPAPIPEVVPGVIRPIADLDVNVDRLRDRTEYRTGTN